MFRRKKHEALTADPAERRLLMEALLQHFPQEHSLNDGAPILLRLMSVRDEVAFLKFSRALPPDDLLFEPRDITSSLEVEEILRGIRRGEESVLLAARGEQILGYASLRHGATRWTRHLGEVRMIVAPAARGTGLGRLLAQTAFDIAEMLGLEDLEAQMVKEQKAARSTFKNLGFQEVATLPRFAIDSKGKKHDLVVMMRPVD